MAHGILLVLSDPVTPEADATYNDWYDDNVHLPEILSLAGFTSARRFRVAEAQLASQGGPGAVRAKFPHRYVAVYEVDAPDVAKAAESLGAASPTLRMSDALDTAGLTAVLLEQISSLGG
jgi:hypothetical protein